jgi:tRNA(fMet)-specific endonuclease VapC
MTKYLLDTDIWVSYLKNKHSIREKVRSCGPDNCFASEISIGELLFGAHNSGKYEKHKDDHLKVLSVAKLLRIVESLDLYGKEKARLKSLGNLIPEFDLLIATSAVFHDYTLVTNNTKHMTRIENIRLENWTLVGDNEFVT